MALENGVVWHPIPDCRDWEIEQKYNLLSTCYMTSNWIHIVLPQGCGISVITDYKGKDKETSGNLQNMREV